MALIFFLQKSNGRLLPGGHAGAGDGEWFWFLACWAGAPDTRITGSCHRVAVCAGRPGHEARVVGWSSAFGSIGMGLPGVCPTVHGHHSPWSQFQRVCRYIVILQNGRKPVSFDFEPTPGSGLDVKFKIPKLSH